MNRDILLALGMTDELARIDAGKCPTCGGAIGEFRDDLSRKEFGISGMCQACQDSVFGAEEPEEVEHEFEDDGQPTEYEEWQDFMGGDDWDHGQFDNDGDF